MSKKKKIYDDGRTIADMNVKGMPGYTSEEGKKAQKNASDLNLTRKEKWQLIKAAYAKMIPLLLIVLLGFLIAGGLISLWLWLGGAM